MPHPLIDPLSKITPFLFALCNDPDIDQLLEKRCKDYKDRLLQFKVAFARQFTSCKEPHTERVLFDISLAGLRINEIFYTFAGKQKIVKQNLAATMEPLELSVKPLGIDTSYSQALRAKHAFEKKQSSKVSAVCSTPPAEKPPTEYNVFIVIYGLLQGDVTLVDDFLNNHNEIAVFIEKNMSFLMEAFCVWEKNDSLSSYKKIHAAISNDQWLAALTLALNEVGSLIWYYNQRRIVEKQSVSVDKEVQVLIGNIHEGTNNPNVDTVFPFLFSKNLVALQIKLDYLKYACKILAWRFPIAKLWAVENLLSELNNVDHISAENGSKLFNFNALLAELPPCAALEAYRKHLQEIIDKFKLRPDAVPVLTRQGTAEYPADDEDESILPVAPSVIENPSTVVKIEENDNKQEVKDERNMVQFKRPLDRKRIRELVLPPSSASGDSKKKKVVPGESVLTSDSSNPPRLTRTPLKRLGAYSSIKELVDNEKREQNSPLEKPEGTLNGSNPPRFIRKPLQRLGAYSTLDSMIRESRAKDDSDKHSATLSQDTSELPGQRPT